MKKVLLGFLFPVLIFGFLTGCDMLSGTDTEDDIAVKGTWSLLVTGPFYSEEVWIITDGSVTYQSRWDAASAFTVNYVADIVSYDNSGLNAGETQMASSPNETAVNPGHAVIRYTQVDNAGWGIVGNYDVFRWCTNSSDSALRDFTQSSMDTDPGPDYVNGGFSTAVEAAANETEAAGYFGYASTGAVKQD
jgi:hypothetical protein